MFIDKMHLEGHVDEDNNVCKDIASAMVVTSKSREGYGLENLRGILMSKARLENDELMENTEDEDSEDGEDNED